MFYFCFVNFYMDNSINWNNDVYVEKKTSKDTTCSLKDCEVVLEKINPELLQWKYYEANYMALDEEHLMYPAPILAMICTASLTSLFLRKLTLQI